MQFQLSSLKRRLHMAEPPKPHTMNGSLEINNLELCPNNNYADAVVKFETTDPS